MSATEGPIETEMNDTEQHATSEDVGTPGSSEVSKTNDMNGETSPVQHKKRHRTSRDTLLTSLTPELTGKRQRKVNPIYSEFALDKKTSHVLGQDEQGKTGTEPNSPVSPAPSTPQATTPTPSSQPIPSQPNSAETPGTLHVSKRELIASPNEVQERNKKLPKGYRYEPVVEAAPVIKKEEPLPQKRERKKSSYVSDFVSDIKDDKKKEKEEKHTKPKKMKKKTPTSTPTSTPIIPPFPATKKQYTPTPTHYGATTPTTYHYQPPFFNNNNITDVQKRKLELEVQMRFLEEQIASVNQKIELKQIELAQIEATKQPKKYIPPTPPAPVAPTPAPVVVAAPAPVHVQPTTPTPLSLPTTPTFDSMEKKGRVGRKAKRSSVYDRFDSEEDEDDEVFSVPKRKGRPPLSSGSKPGRKSRKSRFDEDSSEEEPLDADPKLKQCEALLRRIRKHGYAWPFNQPVDPIALGIPDYYTIITRPMDLGTVGKNLQAGDYGTIEEFADDCRLVFNNATTYNRPGSDIFVMAETLLKVFEEDFSKLSGLPPPPPRVYATPAPLPEDATAITAAPISVAPPVQPSPQPVVVAPQQPPPQPLAHLSPPLVSASYKKEQKTKELLGATIQELRDSMKSVREEIQKMKRDKGLTTPTAAATPTTPAYPASTTPRQGRPGRAREEAKEMTFDEKRILSQNINNLPPENLGKVLQIIHTRMPHLAQAGSDDIEIDIDALDNATLRALDRYVKTCLTKLKKKQAAAKAAEISSQNTAKSIQDVKKKLRELQDKSHAISGRSRRKDHDEDMEIDIDDDTPSRSYPSVLIPKDKDSSSSSDSSSESSSDSSSDSESDSSSDSEDDKPKAKPVPAPAPAPASAPAAAPVVAPAPANPPPLISVNPTPAVEPKEPAQSTPEVPRKAPEPEPEAPKIIQAGNVKKDIELKNLDSWTKLDTFTAPAPTTATTQDATWSQFQAKEMQKKQREKELQEQEERERRERAEREAERRKQEEQRLKEIQEQEEKRRREEEQAKEEAAKNAQRELAEKRAAERRAREAESNKAISSLDQSLAMQSFEQNSVDFSQPNLPFSLKDDKDQQ